MKLVSHKKGSTRERVDADVCLLPVANWRLPIDSNVLHLVVSSQWGTGERSYELWLTEREALGIAEAVAKALFDEAVKRINEPRQP